MLIPIFLYFSKCNFSGIGSAEGSDSVRRFPRVLGQFWRGFLLSVYFACIAFSGAVMKLY